MWRRKMKHIFQGYPRQRKFQFVYLKLDKKTIQTFYKNRRQTHDSIRF